MCEEQSEMKTEEKFVHDPGRGHCNPMSDSYMYNLYVYDMRVYRMYRMNVWPRMSARNGL